MTNFNLTSPRLLSKRSGKRFAFFLIASFAYTFIITPAFAAEAIVTVDAEVDGISSERQIIKSPGSTIKLNERLVHGEKEFSADVPPIGRNFKLLPPEQRIQAGKIIKGKPLFFNSSPVPAGSHIVTMTAYNSEKGQTDNDPCTAASGFNLCKHNTEDSVAANFLPMGTVIKAPALFGDREFVVRDRTHPKYGDRVDFWFRSRADALQFGKRRAAIVVVSVPDKVRIATVR